MASGRAHSAGPPHPPVVHGPALRLELADDRLGYVPGVIHDRVLASFPWAMSPSRLPMVCASPRSSMLLSVAAAVATIVLKTAAW